MDPRMSRILVASVCEVRASALPKTHAPGYSPHASSPPYTPRASPLDLAATAAAHFELGAQAYAAKQWDAARAEFQVCFELSKRTDLLHNLSLVAEKQGRIADATRARLSRAHPAYRARAQRSHKAHRAARGPSTCASSVVVPVALSAAALPSPHVGSEGVAAPRHPSRGLMIAGLGTGGVLLFAAGGLGIAGQLAKNSLNPHHPDGA